MLYLRQDWGTNMSASENVAALKAAYDAYNRGDFAPVDSLMSDKVVVSGPTGTGAFHSLGWEGRKGFRQFAAEIQEDWNHRSTNR